MADVTAGEIVLVSIVVIGVIVIAVLFWKGLDLPPERCAPSESGVDTRIIIESELIQ